MENLTPTAGGHSADIRFSLPGAISGLELVIGAQGADPMAVANAQSFTPVNQGGEAYLAAVNFTTAPQDAVFQLRWTDANGHRNQTRPTGIQQQQSLLIFDGSVTTEPGDTAGAHDMTVTWHLPPELVQSYTGQITDPDTGVLSARPPSRYSHKTAPKMPYPRLFFRLFREPICDNVR